LALFASPVQADVKTFTVSLRAGQGTHTDIQKAINDCSASDICTINLVDSVYTVMRPIWIEGKSNLTLVSKRTSTKPILQFLPTLLSPAPNPNLGKGGAPPTTVAKLFTLPFIDPVTGVADPKRPAGWLMWPFEGSTSNLPLAGSDPGHTNDTTTGYSSSGFQHNGLIVVKKSQDVTIRGLLLRSTPTFFQNRNVWGGANDVLFGNVGINLIQSLRGKIQDCDVTGFFTAFYIQGRNVGGAFGRPNPNDLDDAEIVPLSRFGQVGDHLIERNFVTNNWWFAYNEIDWDLGSTIRYNVAFQNMNKAFQYGDTLTDPTASSNELNNMTGGFMFAKDAVVIPHKIYNNTITSSPIVLGHGYWRRNDQLLFYNNVISFANIYDKAGKLILAGAKDQHNLLRMYGEMVWHNTIQLQPGVGDVVTKSSGNFNIKDTAIHIQYSGSTSFQTCGGGCYANGVKLLEPYVATMSPNKLFDNWGIQQGVYVRVAGDSVDWTKVATNATITGYQGKIYSIWENNGYSLWGLFNSLPGIDTSAARLRENFWAMRLPTQGGVDSNTKVVASVNALAPLWTDPAVIATIRNKAWKNADLGGPDGDVSDRGAFQYDSLSGRTVLGGIRNGVQLDVVDQRIVDMKGTRVKIPMIVQQTDGVDPVAAYYTGVRVDSVYYYPEFPFSSVDDADGTEKPFPRATVVKSGLAWSGVSGDSLIFNVPVGVTFDYGRFDIFVSAVDPVSSSRVNAVGSYVYRKADYKLAIDFCTNGTNATTCAASLVKRTRVGETVQMRIRILDANDVETPLQVVSNLMVTPGAAGKMINMLTGNAVDTSIFRSSFTGSLISPVQFQTVGQNDVGAAGVVGAVGSAKGIMGAGSIFVQAGPPYRVQWVTPASTKVVPCKPSTVSPFAMDTATFCGDELPPSGLTAADLRVYDRFGNQVTEPATVKVTGTKEMNPILAAASAQGIATVSSSVTGTAVDSVKIVTDSMGRGTVWITGLASVVGTYPKGWVQFLARVDSANLPTDTTRVRLGKPAMHLLWANPKPIDTTIRTSMPVRLVVSLDTLPEATGAYASAKVRVWASASRGIVFYRDAARTLPVTDSMVTLSNGQITLWVASDVATPVNNLLAELVGLPGVPEYEHVRFFVPVPPPSPVPDSAVFLDRNCDGASDVARLWLKATASSPAALDTTKVKPELLLVKYADGTIDSVRATGWRAVGGDFSVLDLTLAKAPRTTAPVGDLTMIVRLRRPPADDTVITAGSAIAIRDRVSPRPVTGAIIENFSPGVVADTVRVSFSEPVSFTGSAWPFLTREPAGTVVNTAALSVAPMAATPSTSLVFVVSGNAGGTLVHAGQSIAIDSNSLLVDAFGNHGKGGECLGDTAILALVPQPVPMVSSSIRDANGDGAAERVTVEFRRRLRAVDVPDSLIIGWGGLSVRTDLSGATTSDSTTWTVVLAQPFPKGVTAGGGVAGAGSLETRDGAGASLVTQTIDLADSVAPIPTKARLAYGPRGGLDTLFVTYSEPMIVRAGTSWMLDQRLGDAALTVGAGKAVSTDLTQWAFTADPGAAAYPRAGDSIRLPGGTASNFADARGVLPTSPLSPYVEVVGDPIRLIQAALRDIDGDGSADQATVLFLRPLRPSDMPDSLVFTWGSQTRAVKLAGAATTDSASWTLSLPVPFAKGVTRGAGINGSGDVQSLKGAGISQVSVHAPLADSVSPIPLRAELKYGFGGARDTLLVVYSEPLVRKAGSAWMLHKRLGDAAVSVLGGLVAGADSSEWLLLVDPAGPVYARPGDSIRLPAGVASNLADVRGILPASPTSPYVVVVGPPIPMVSSFLRDANGDGKADRVSVTFLKPLAPIDMPDSLILGWGAEARTVAFAGASTLDSTTWTLSVSIPFAKGVTQGTAASGAGSVTLRKGVRTETLGMADSVAPVPTRAELRYGVAGALDTLVVTYSENLAKRPGTQWMLNQRLGDAPVGVVSGDIAGDASIWALLVDPALPGFARPGDSIRLPSGSASSLVDARGNEPTSPVSPYVRVVGGDRPPTRAWYRDADGDGRVDRVVLEFSVALASDPSYQMHWAGEVRHADPASYGGTGVGATRLEIVLDTAFAFGATSSAVEASYGIQTSSLDGTAWSISTFPIADSVPPVILTARVGYTSYNNPGERDTLFLKLSEPVLADGYTVVLGRGGDGNAYPIGYDHPQSRDLLQASPDSLLFFCDTSCVKDVAAAGMPANGDSVRLSWPQGGIFVRDAFGNAPGADAKWTRVVAGDRPYNYSVDIFPSGVLVEEGRVPDPTIKSRPSLSIWVLQDGRWWEFRDGQKTGISFEEGAGGPIETNGVGLLIDINSAFQASVLMYDNIGVHVGNAEISIDSAMAKALGNSAGKFKILILFNGRRDSDPNKVVGSGVYLIRYLTFRDELQSTGRRERRLLENRIFKIGYKGKSK